jgi:hypothetical protein
MDFIRCRALAFVHGAASVRSRRAAPPLVAFLAFGVFIVISLILPASAKELNLIALHPELFNN